MKRAILPLCAVLALSGASVTAQQDAGFDSDEDARIALARALSQAKAAESEAERLDERASQVTEKTERTAREAAALAARIQQSEAEIAAAEARITLINQRRRAQQLRLAQKQEPVVRLTAALQMMARRPVGLALAKPGEIKQMVHLRAVLDGMLPVVRARTADLRGEIANGRKLRAQAVAATGMLRKSRTMLDERRASLATIESQQRLELREARGAASRETDRAIALAEEARDIEDLMQQMEAAGDLRGQLAALPGPVLRPVRPEASQVENEGRRRPEGAAPAYRLPVQGRVITGTGEVSDSGVRSRGVTIAPAPGAQLVAPAAGRVVFAGPYRGFGQIVIIEHDGGWSSLITGMARITPAVGDRISSGDPLGIAGVDRPAITVELRRQGRPIDVIALIAAG